MTQRIPRPRLPPLRCSAALALAVLLGGCVLPPPPPYFGYYAPPAYAGPPYPAYVPPPVVGRGYGGWGYGHRHWR